MTFCLKCKSQDSFACQNKTETRCLESILQSFHVSNDTPYIIQEKIYKIVKILKYILLIKVKF